MKRIVINVTICLYAVCKTTATSSIVLNGYRLKLKQKVPDQDKECVFPFRYNEEIYSKCTSKGWPYSCPTCSWCGTTYNVTDKTGWGLCNGNCPNVEPGWNMTRDKWRYLLPLTTFDAGKNLVF